MRISPVSNMVNQNLKISKNKNQSFQGLWGKTSHLTDFDQTLSVPKTVTTYYYYPFNDEPQSKIDSIIDKNSSASIVDNSRYVVNLCKQCYTLPFDESEYDDYLSVSTPSQIKPETKMIHNHVINKYLNKEIGTGQHIAVNSTIGPTLDALRAL